MFVNAKSSLEVREHLDQLDHDVGGNGRSNHALQGGHQIGDFLQHRRLLEPNEQRLKHEVLAHHPATVAVLTSRAHIPQRQCAIERERTSRHVEIGQRVRVIDAVISPTASIIFGKTVMSVNATPSNCSPKL